MVLPIHSRKAREPDLYARPVDSIAVWMKLLLSPWSMGVNAARHLAWYVNYQVNGATRPRA